MWCREQDGSVAEVTTTDPAGRYPAAVVWIEVPLSLRKWIATDWIIVDGVPGPPTLDHLVDQLLAKVAARGESEAARGVVMPDSYRVDTSERGRTLLLGAYLRAAQLAQSAPQALIRWKLSRRVFESASVSTVMRRGAAAIDHVQHCIDREFTITQAILAAADVAAAIAAYDAAIDAYGATGATGWPGPAPGDQQG
ncbi:DUF4376 domain-containing protein [Azospirillum cavernae]|uniref:DUF4376 domain-containing protein n=1 Tax=Azospirillum cavernae TaxID=2320860 RepID=A0A418VVE6_9PROT|nr:DUF4376 domain-containing protein [Azospirillum cavernae]RJF81132.1 DUF4376 domain-containing protein [Azospirillum cavernae]